MRTQLELLTGIRGLATNTALCDRVLNSACRYLEAVQDTPQSKRRFFAKPSSGVYVLDLQNLRAVTRVFISNGVGRYQLDYLEYDNAKREGLISTTFTAGQPEAYSVTIAGRAPEQESSSSSDFVTAGYDADAYGDIKFGSMFEYSRLLFLPPTDGTWTFDVHGKFWPRTLSAGTDTNWWTVNAPDTVAYAAAMVLEWERRNPEAAKDWMEAAKVGLNAIDIQLAEEEMAPWDDVDDMAMQG